jgi:ribose-phosphate pyrophosphokinase
MARACKERGALDVYACVSHAVFAKNASAKIAASPIKELVVTDTIHHTAENLPPNAKVISVASLFAKAILSIHRRESVSRLFESEEEDGPEAVTIG